jgi:formate dehydrogenase maturation protein FdhE
VAHPQQGSPARPEPREITELRRLREDQPDLAAAIDLQIELVQLQRRVQSRVSLPSIPLDASSLNARLTCAPILAFEHIPMDWGDLRFLVRATATAMRNHEALEDEDFRKAEQLARDATRLEQVVRAWYEGARRNGAEANEDDGVLGLENVLQQAMRPFLTRAADAIMARIDFAGWEQGRCPLCAGEPDLAVITPAAERLLICSRCQTRWRFHQLTCPFCLNPDRSRITSFASRDGRYRIYACDVCERYIKAYDARQASRPVLPVVDAVATLPLDAAAMQKGYR